MSLPNIGLIGKAQSGKDSVADRLVSAHAYSRIAFADPLREMALSIDPWIPTGEGQRERLSEIVAEMGWDAAKRTYPEVRRFLQTLGASVRENDEFYWVNIALRKIGAAQKLNMPVVITDCRYQNEAKLLGEAGFKIVRVSRPGTALSGDAASHPSETELDGFKADAEIWNGASLSELDKGADLLTDPSVFAH